MSKTSGEMKGQGRSMVADPRIREALNVIFEFALGNLKARGTISEKNDDIDALITGINMLGEELGANIAERKQASEELRASEEKFKGLFETAHDGIILADVETKKFLTGNKTICGMLGYEEEELKTISVFDIHPEKDRPYVMELFEKQARSEIKLAIDLPVKRKDGSIFYAGVNMSSLIMGGRTYLLGILRDMTERKQNEDRLRVLHEFNRLIIDSLTHPFIVINVKDHTIAMKNAAASAMGEGATCHAVSHNKTTPCGSDEQPCPLEEVKRTKKPAIAEHIHYDRDGNPRNVEVHCYPVFDSVKNVDQVIEYSLDITERKKMEKALQESLGSLERKVSERTAELEASNKELDSFAYVVSHDLKAPLRAITSLSSWLEADYADKLDDEGRTSLDLLVQRARRMNSLIDGILQYSRVGRFREEMKLVDLNTVVRDVLELLSADEHVVVTIETKLPTILCEKTRIHQVFQNLIGNAVKHMDKPAGEIKIGCVDMGKGGPASPPVRKDIRTISSNKDFHTFYVSDNGPGIEERYFDKIFQIFQTLKPRDEVETAGVGLTIVKKIVELYGGVIWVESKVGKGSTFWFSIAEKQRER